MTLSSKTPEFVLSELQRTKLWAALGEAEQECLFARSRTVVASKDDVLVCEGEAASGLFFVISGTLRKVRTECSGRRNVVGFAFGSDFNTVPGDLVELSVADRYPYAIEATGDAIVFALPRQDLVSLCQENPTLNRLLLDLISREYHKTQSHIDRLMAGPVMTKLARFLLDLGARIGQPDQGTTILPMGMGRQDIADHLAHSVEAVSRAFTQMRNAEVISFSQDKPSCVILRDETLLRCMAYPEAQRDKGQPGRPGLTETCDIVRIPL